MAKFQCEQCGSCCRAIGCDKLDGNKCTIYENRPDICNVDKTYKKYHKQDISRKKFYSINKRICAELRAQYGT